MQIHELPDVTAIGSGGYFATDNGSQTTKIDYDALAKAIIEQYSASTLAGSAQSVKSALDGIKTDLNVVYGANPIKTLAATDDLLTLDVGMYRVANVLPLNAPSTTYKYGYATKQHRGASGYTYYEFIVGNGNGNDFKRYYGWQYSNSATSIDWIEMAPQSAVDALNSNISSNAGGVPIREAGTVSPSASFSIDMSNAVSQHEGFALVALQIAGNSAQGVQLLFLGKGTSKTKALLDGMGANIAYTATYSAPTWSITNNTENVLYYTVIKSK